MPLTGNRMAECPESRLFKSEVYSLHACQGTARGYPILNRAPGVLCLTPGDCSFFG
jgi:hypothetical protein